MPLASLAKFMESKFHLETSPQKEIVPKSSPGNPIIQSTASAKDCIILVDHQSIQSTGGNNNRDKRSGSLDKTDKNKLRKKIGTFLETTLGSSPEPRPVLPVLASELPYLVLREFGTVIIRICIENADRVELDKHIDNNPVHRKGLKGVLVELISRAENTTGNSSLSILLYSMPDDKFDLLTYNANLSKIMKQSSLSAVPVGKPTALSRSTSQSKGKAQKSKS